MRGRLIKGVIVLLVILFSVLTILHRKNNTADELVFWTLQMGDFAPYMNKVIGEFEAQNDVKIKWVDVP